MYSPDGTHKKLLARKLPLSFDGTQDFAAHQAAIREKLTELMEFDVVGDIQGMGTLWAIELMDDREKRTKLAEPYGVFIRDWCYEHGMILRNNGNMLVIAPPIVITDEELDLVMNNLRQAIQAAMKHFNR